MRDHNPILPMNSGQASAVAWGRYMEQYSALLALLASRSLVTYLPPGLNARYILVGIAGP